MDYFNVDFHGLEDKNYPRTRILHLIKKELDTKGFIQLIEEGAYKQ